MVLDAPLPTIASVVPGTHHDDCFPRTDPIINPPGGTNYRGSSAPSQSAVASLHASLRERADLWERIRKGRIRHAFSNAGVTIPAALRDDYIPPAGIDLDLKAALSEYIRKTGISLPKFVELWRGQTSDDYRPNKSLVPDVLRTACANYHHLEPLLRVASEGIRVSTRRMPRQSKRPRNHASATDCLPVLLKKIAAEQHAGRVLVLDADILALWPEIQISPFGIVAKSTSTPSTDGRWIHDLSFPPGWAVNDFTTDSAIPAPLYRHCAAVAVEIVESQAEHPGDSTVLSASDVSAAFRHVPIHSASVYLFGGLVPEIDALVIDLFAPFGWTLSPACYELFGGAISHIHGGRANEWHPDGFFAYHWVDDHVNVGPDVEDNCAQISRSLHHAMLSVLGPTAINEKKFTGWHAQLKVLGLHFDAATLSVAMPVDKIIKARSLVESAMSATRLDRTTYRSLLGSLRHVATCVRPARVFLQRLRRFELGLDRSTSVLLDSEALDDLRWWLLILHSAPLNGVPLEYFGSLPPPDIVVQVDASDHGLAAFDTRHTSFITHAFTASERRAIDAFKNGSTSHADINFRELLSCAFAVHTWGSKWGRLAGRLPVHVHFRIDNTSAVAWQNRLSSGNPRAQVLIRLLGYWESLLGLRFSASHVPGQDNVLADLGLGTSLMGRFDTPLAVHLREHAVADSTLRRYRYAWSLWRDFCAVERIPELLTGADDATAGDIVSGFVLRCLQSDGGRKAATITGFLHGIHHFFQTHGRSLPFRQPQVRLLLRGIERLDAPPVQKAAATPRLLRACYLRLDLSARADQALWGVLCLSFFFLLRRSEIVADGQYFKRSALRATDIMVSDQHGLECATADKATSVTISLRGSKANQHGPPEVRTLSKSGHKYLCPVLGALALLRARQPLQPDWPAAMITSAGQLKAVSATQVAEALQAGAASIGLRPDHYSCHSLRSGGATQMYKGGLQATTVQFHGRWASDTYKRYIQQDSDTSAAIASRMVQERGN